MKILLIEDDGPLAEGLVDGLTKAGFAVDLLVEGDVAVRRLSVRHDSYDVIILDLTLPKMSGLDVCREARAEGIHTPILILTGKDDSETKVTALNAGADDYLTKPFAFEELVARIHALLRRPTQIETSELIVGSIALNPVTHKVYKDGKEVPLTLKEFSILEYLMRNPGQVVQRDQIIDHAWDFSFSSLSNVIDVNITNIRKKLRLAKDEVLETVRGVGYRIKHPKRPFVTEAVTQEKKDSLPKPAIATDIEGITILIHDIRSHLAVSKLYMDMLEEKLMATLSEKEQEMVHRVIAANRSALGIIETLSKTIHD